MRSILPCVVVALALAPSGRGDTVLLKDGTRVEGQVLAMTDAAVTVEVRLGRSKGQVVIPRADLLHVVLGEAAPVESATATAPAPAPAPPPAAEGATTARPAEAADPTDDATDAGERVVFLLDTSGSMAIGQRWAQARAEVLRRARTLPAGGRFCLIPFHEDTDVLFGTFVRGNEGSLARLEAALARLRPDLRAGTHLPRAIAAALRRRPTRVVLVTDGVTTRGVEALVATFEAVGQAAARGVVLDAVAVHDGTSTPAGAEDLAAATGVLERLAREGRGMAAALPRAEQAPPAAFRPVNQPPRADVEVQLAMPVSNNVISARVLGAYRIQFRVRVRDPEAARTLHVVEYGGAPTYEVLSKLGDDVIDRTDRLELVPEGDPERLHLTAPRHVVLVGSADGRHRTTSDAWRGNEGRTAGTLPPNANTAVRRDYVTLQVVPGGTLEVIYHRGDQEFRDIRALREANGDLPHD